MIIFWLPVVAAALVLDCCTRLCNW